MARLRLCFDDLYMEMGVQSRCRLVGAGCIITGGTSAFGMAAGILARAYRVSRTLLFSLETETNDRLIFFVRGGVGSIPSASWYHGCLVGFHGA